MKYRIYIPLLVFVVASIVVGCSGGSASSATLEDQAKMVRGSAPTKDQLAKAMKDYHGLGGTPHSKAPGGAPKH